MTRFLRQDNLSYRFYPVVIFTPFGHFKDLNGNEFRLVSSSPSFRNNASLLRHGLVSHNTSQDVRCRYDSIAAANPAKVCQYLTLRSNIQLFIRIQDLEGRKMESGIIGSVIEGVDIRQRQHRRIPEHLFVLKHLPLERVYRSGSVLPSEIWT